jgi:2-polyprenyl-3-methyl-5-hydroxy-6-metoxy-1,4-benzoquinol methylase
MLGIFFIYMLKNVKDNSDFVRYYALSRPEMLKYIPDSVSKILEVGCGTGFFGKQIKSINKCEYWGIEPVKQAADEAINNIDKIVNSSFDECYNSLPKNYFDCVIFNDVLEHLENPFDTLKKLFEILPGGCKVISSIPNVLYFFNIKDLLIKKDWEYSHQGGILDFTHLRFFTKKSMIRMFSNAGYKIKIIEGINPIQLWISIPLNILSFGHLNESKFMQFVVVAEK